ncbi:hypothetical protein [Gulosibacter bifidus]|uniref:Uncharacterized protein n=1 Tax=Gulosibacter bifidus TaxID=272239 RepID=A0ABW5RIS0_9MICO|nr:hypothetical protein [Gulosibacter bifidus]
METAYQLQCKVPDVEPTGLDVLGWIERALDKVSGWISFGHKLLDGFGIGSVLDKLNEALNNFKTFIAKLKEVATKLFEAIKGVFMPWIMPTYADKWLQISHDMDNVAKALGPTGLRAPGSPAWTGQAADAYRAKAAQSVKAAQHASKVANTHSESLAECAHQGQQLYIELLTLVIAIIAAMLAAGVEAGTIVGIPAAIVTLLAGAFPLAANIADTIIALFDFIAGQVSTFNEITSALEGATDVFPGNAWPKLSAPA